MVMGDGAQYNQDLANQNGRIGLIDGAIIDKFYSVLHRRWS